MKIGICGASYFSSIKEGEIGAGKHFTDKLAEKYGYEIIMMARGGCSNFTIRMQIDEVLKHNPHFIIVGTTSPERIEFPINSTGNWEDIHNPNFGIWNINYHGYKDKSSEYFRKASPTMVSQNLSSLSIGNYPDKIKKEKITAIKHYISYLYDYTYKKVVDSLIIAEGIRKIHSLGIPFFVVQSGIDLRFFDFCRDNVIFSTDESAPYKYGGNLDEEQFPFHTSEREQDILCEIWHKKIKNEIEKYKKQIKYKKRIL